MTTAYPAAPRPTHLPARWREGPGGVPVPEDCPSWFAGRVLWRMDAGDHGAFLLEPIEARDGSAAGELSFHRAKRIQAGHEA